MNDTPNGIGSNIWLLCKILIDSKRNENSNNSKPKIKHINESNVVTNENENKRIIMMEIMMRQV